MKIMLDPGHGGNDPGAVGNGLQEKTLNLTIARHIRDMLNSEYQGVEVRMTRDSDVFVGLSQRAALANQWGANYFMSIHINAGGGTGFESFIYNTRPASSVRAQDLIHPQIVQAMGVTDRGKKSANFAVLRETNMPSILTENLFIDRAADAERLKNATFLRTIARGHVNGLERAFNLQRRGSGGGNLYRVVVDGTQVGAFSEHQNILNAIEQRIGSASNILAQKV
ncbi:N-acetylmuramoyl-L-alanine amidase family protein [Bacillus horti]|uniref:N-acetylmuramoyl-L-alanine amidase n=1 Tax=Caldalkalibacillus horti TaxID=77523 RepID=A0ABT9VXD7_9BACI|nr:N-acetylmuramoyl-L-alanine amidase [Bacillus horti]MDQ0165656.1 N-acetylmuramoyl-L-alanine amidase [Bacillus horti]